MLGEQIRHTGIGCGKRRNRCLQARWRGTDPGMAQGGLVIGIVPVPDIFKIPTQGIFKKSLGGQLGGDGLALWAIFIIFTIDELYFILEMIDSNERQLRWWEANKKGSNLKVTNENHP